MVDSDVKRSKKRRQKKRDAGYIPKEIWIKPEWWPEIQAMIRKMIKGEK